MLDLSKPVQWTDGDRHRVGRVAIVRYTGTRNGHVYDYEIGGGRKILIRHEHTDKLEFVPVVKLSQYPSEPIPEPEAEGGK